MNLHLNQFRRAVRSEFQLSSQTGGAGARGDPKYERASEKSPVSITASVTLSGREEPLLKGYWR